MKSFLVQLLIAILFIKSIYNIEVFRKGQYTYKQMAIIKDLPSDADLDKYLKVLEKAMFFVTMHKNYVDMHLSFGIFLASVNIRSVMKYQIAENLRSRFRRLLLAAEDNMEYFYKTVSNHKREQRRVLLPLLSLYVNETAWLNNLEPFNTRLLNKTKHYFRKDLEEHYSKWSKYEESISSRRVGPNPRDEEDCFNQLAENPVNRQKTKVICHMPFPCSKFILNGTSYGYDIKNRLLIVIAATFSRGCTIVFDKDNKELINEFCATMYNEAEYISYHDFNEATLIMEQMALCSLAGHAQFLRESWIDELTDFQTAVGCFDMNRPTMDNTNWKEPSKEQEDWKFMQTKSSIWDGTCYTHITSSAIAVFAAVIRYLIETYYVI